MSTGSRTWHERRSELASLLGVPECGEHGAPTHVDQLALAVERSSKLSRRLRSAIESLRFSDSDFSFINNLDRGQFGTLETTRCIHDGKVYARKCVQKHITERYKDQCFVRTEREILSRATVNKCPWVVWLLCAFQTSTALVLIMEYAAGGNLSDLIASIPNSRVSEADLRWWLPQAISSIHWCHEQGFAHRDIKPHNFVVAHYARLKLIDFGCAAPLICSDSKLPRYVAKPYCLVPCGTCDYISPEILQAHEDALFAAEIDGRVEVGMDERGYGCETDWWSLGAVIYELVLGVAPFFSPNIPQTYSRIVQHEGSDIEFDEAIPLSLTLCDLIRRFLTTADQRLGSGGIGEIRSHPWFADIAWSTLDQRYPPPTLFIPPYSQHSYASNELDLSQDRSSPFDFSHLFKSSMHSSSLDQSPFHPLTSPAATSHAGFSWGPLPDAFDDAPLPAITPAVPVTTSRTSKSLDVPTARFGSLPNGIGSMGRHHHMQTTPDAQSSGPQSRQPSPKDFKTPNRPTLSYYNSMTPQAEGSGLTSSRCKRLISDREALMQMMVLVSASARKKVLESGRKPRLTTLISTECDLSKLPIPSFLKKQKMNRPHDLDTSISFDDSAPPSPSPRPGSSMSRRSGSASPFPYVRSAAPTPVLDPTLVFTGTSRSLSNGIVSGRAGHVSNPPVWEEAARRAKSSTSSLLFTPTGSNGHCGGTEKGEDGEVMVNHGSPHNTPMHSDYWSASLSEVSSTVDVGLVESSITKLFKDLSKMESKVASLKAFAQIDSRSNG